MAFVRDFKRIIRWTEDDSWDDANHTCTFGQTIGDFSVYSGVWRFEEAGTRTHLVLELEYEYVPLIPFLLEGVAADPALNLPDGIHPNAAGQRIVADTVAEALAPLVAELAAASERTAVAP